MTFQPTLIEGTEIPDVEAFTRLAGERLVKLTGNGPATRSERIRQLLRLAPRHPTYKIYGQQFVSDGPAGALTAITPSNSSILVSSKGVTIQTITDAETTTFGVDGDLKPFLEGALLDVDPLHGWSPHSPEDVAQRLARIGRLLKFGTVSQRLLVNDHIPQLVVVDDPQLKAVVFALLRGAMLLNGCGDGEAIDYTPPSPTTELDLSPEGMDVLFDPAFLRILRDFATPEVKVGYLNGELCIRRSVIHVEVGDIPTTEKLKITKTVLDFFDKQGWDPDLLIFQRTAGA